jgi:hypothetical protein
MGKLKPGAAIIYESPDGGDTVYGRYAGTNDRWMVGQSANAKDRLDAIKEDKLWGEIRRAAKSNDLLREALERAIMIYHLSKKDGN